MPNTENQEIENEETEEHREPMREEFEESWKSIWKPILYKDGVIDEEQVKREIHDYDYIIGQVRQVYSEVTGGNLSKPMYQAETVIEAYQEHVKEQSDFAIECEMEATTRIFEREGKWVVLRGNEDEEDNHEIAFGATPVEAMSAFVEEYGNPQG